MLVWRIWSACCMYDHEHVCKNVQPIFSKKRYLFWIKFHWIHGCYPALVIPSMWPTGCATRLFNGMMFGVNDPCHSPYVINRIRAYTHWGWAHRQRVSTTLWLGKTHKCRVCSWRGWNLGSLDLESDALPIEPPSQPVSSQFASIGPHPCSNSHPLSSRM